MKVRKAVFPAAGLGTRFLPATKAQPKEMLPLVDKPVIQYVVEEALASGIEDIIVVTGRSKRAIEDHFDVSVELERYLEDRGQTELLEQVRAISDLIRFSYVRQKEPLGLGQTGPPAAARTAPHHHTDPNARTLATARRSRAPRPARALVLQTPLEAPAPPERQNATPAPPPAASLYQGSAAAIVARSAKE